MGEKVRLALACSATVGCDLLGGVQRGDYMNGGASHVVAEQDATWRIEKAAAALGGSVQLETMSSTRPGGTGIHVQTYRYDETTDH